MNIPEILPCPFCGKQPMKHHAIPNIVCCVDHECGGYVRWWPLELWNRRQPTPEAADNKAVCDAVSTALHEYHCQYTVDDADPESGLSLYDKLGKEELDLLEDALLGAVDNAHPPKPEPTDAPPAYMFSVRRLSPAGQPSLDTFAAIDYHCQDGEELKSKEPLLYGVAHKPPAEQISGVPLLHPQPKPGESVTVSYEPPAEWMEAAAREIISVTVYGGLPVPMVVGDAARIKLIETTIAKHYEHAPKVPEGWQMVPVEPTRDMRDSGGREFLEARDRTSTTEWDDAAIIYKAMLAAAPKEIK